VRLARRPPTWPAALLAAVLVGPALARPAPPPPLPPAPFPADCRLDVRLFRSLRHGPVTYCRKRLAYAPGALECYQFTDRICSVFVPETGELVRTRLPVAPVVFPCPDAPAPPVCPRLDFR
jgi:hypothetical protein